MMDKRPKTAATVSPLMVRIEAESKQVLAARLACSTIVGVKKFRPRVTASGFRFASRKRSKRNAWQSHEPATWLFATIPSRGRSESSQSATGFGSLNLWARRLGCGLRLRHKLHDSKAQLFSIAATQAVTHHRERLGLSNGGSQRRVDLVPREPNKVA